MKMKKIYGFAIISSLLISHLAFALPEAPIVEAGALSIQKDSTTMTIKQTSSSAVINWQSFNTASNETVFFRQPDQNSTILNRITSGLPTNFAGNLIADGKVFIVNPAGMVFAEGSKINAASFVATTFDINDTDFMRNDFTFHSVSGHEDSKIINNGIINVTGANDILALMAPNVYNGKTGVLQAHLQRVFLQSAPGGLLTLSFDDGLILVDTCNVIQTKALAIENTGTIQGGFVMVGVASMNDILDNTISMAGVTEAKGIITDKKGIVMLFGVGGVNTTISGSVKADNDILLVGKKITETPTGRINAQSLETASPTDGTSLNSQNKVAHYTHKDIPNDVNYFPNGIKDARK